jgi:hypothetical protein
VLLRVWLEGGGFGGGGGQLLLLKVVVLVVVVITGMVAVAFAPPSCPRVECWVSTLAGRLRVVGGGAIAAAGSTGHAAPSTAAGR